MITKSVVSNVDLVRRFVFENQPVSIERIAQALRVEMQSIKTDELARDRYVLPVLRSQPYYKEVDGGWAITREQMPEYRVLAEVMREEKRLMYERDVRSKVAAKLGMKVLTVVLDLKQAPELAQHGSRWGLKEWKIVNDEAAEVLAQHTNGLSEKDLLKHVCDRFGIAAEIAVLDLERDAKKRFAADRKLWLLKENVKATKTTAAESKPALPELKDRGLNLLLEGSFLQAQTARGSEGGGDGSKESKSKLRKTLRKEAQDILEHRDDLSGKPEDLAARLSQVLSAAGVADYEVTSFQRVEPASREKGLSQKEREEIQQFIDQLLEQETTGVGPSLQSVVNTPLSARKLQDVLRLKYISYTRDRAVLPAEYYALLIDILRPTIDSTVLNPACFEGLLAVELFNHLYEALDGAAWTLADDGATLEIVQGDGARYQLASKDEALAEAAREHFLVSQLDLLNHFLNYKYTGIEPDKVLARSARIITRLAGSDNAYIVSRDFLAELPEVFNYPANEDNELPLRFNFVAGNFTFTQDANLAANYLDQSLRLLEEGGSCGVFVLHDLLVLLKEHQLLGEFLKRKAVTHFVRLPVIEGRHKVVLVVLRALMGGEEAPPIHYAEVRDFKSANELGQALLKGGAEAFARHGELIEPNALGVLIG